MDPLVAKLSVAQTGDCVIFIKTLLRPGGGFHIPFDQRGAHGLGHFGGQHGLARPRLTLDQQRAAQGHGGVDRDFQVVCCNIGLGTGKFLRHARSCGVDGGAGLRRDAACRKCGYAMAIVPPRRALRHWPGPGTALRPTLRQDCSNPSRTPTKPLPDRAATS